MTPYKTLSVSSSIDKDNPKRLNVTVHEAKQITAYVCLDEMSDFTEEHARAAMKLHEERP